MAESLAPRGTLMSILPVDLSAALFKSARPVHLDPGQTLFLAGDPGDGCYRVDEGLVKVHAISPYWPGSYSRDPWTWKARRRSVAV